jgi:hypothetical protein
MLYHCQLWERTKRGTGIEADPVPWNPLEKEAKVSKPLPWSTIVVPLLSSATRNAHKNGTGLETSVGQSGPEFRLQEEAR